jgi:CRISPR/Cas system-associated exonuclease Cas4 (RecB family)
MISEKISGLLVEAGTQQAKDDSEAREKVTQGFTGASQLGWVQDCPRRLCLMRMCPDKAKDFDEKTKARFQEGKKHESLIRADLEGAGIKLVHPGRLTWPALELTGELDDLVEVGGKQYPIDYKTCSSAMFSKVQRAQSKDDLLRSPFIWIRHYPAQLQAYMLMTQKMPSVLFFKDKESGQRHLMDVELDPAYASSLLDGLRYVNECVKKEDPPKAEMKEACEACGFYDFDFPDVERGAAAGQLEVIAEETWLMKLKEYQMMLDQGVAKAVKDFEKLDKEIKEEFRGRRVLVGAHLIESKVYFTTFFDIPADEKMKYQKQREQFRTSIKLVAGAL